MRQLAESGVHAVYHNSFHEQFVTNLNGEDYYDHPHSVVMQPVFDAFGSDQVAGFLLGVVAWDRYFAKLLPDEVNNIVAVLRNSCGDSFTYIIDGDKVRNRSEVTRPHQLTLLSRPFTLEKATSMTKARIIPS